MALCNRSRVIIGTIVLLTACSERGASPSHGAPPAATGSAAPATPKRHESKDPASKPPQGYRRMAVGGVTPTSGGSAVVLTDEEARRGLVLRSAGSEALA